MPASLKRFSAWMKAQHLLAAQVMTACASMQFRDEGLLHALAAAVGRR